MLDALQYELAETPVRMFGVNQNGDGGLFLSITDGRSIPWLQDTDGAATESWDALHFDLVILDRGNNPFRVINLTEFDLADPDNYAELRLILAEAVTR